MSVDPTSQPACVQEMLDAAAGLVRVKDGLWRTSDAKEVSYPDLGHDRCHAVEESSFWFNHRNRIIGTMVARHVPPGPFFDIGGGNGWVSLFLKQQGRTVVLVEPGINGVSHASARGLPRIVHGKIEDARFSSGSIHSFGLFDVLEHISDRIGFLQMLRDLGSADCRLAITVPAYRLLWSDADDRAGHHERYTRQRLNDELESAGWRPLFTSYFFCALPPLIWLGRSLPYRLRGREPSPVSAEGLCYEHGANRFVSNALRAILFPEVSAISRGIPLPFGASLCCVAGPRAPERSAP